MKRLLTLIITLLLFCTCERKSPLSYGKLEDLSLIRADFEISSSNDENMYAWGNLYDKDDYPIDNDSVKIKVNNIDLILRKIPGMGLNDYQYSSQEKIPFSDKYILEIVLTNGKTHFLGLIYPLEKNNESNIICNEKGDFNKDALISWKNLKEINQLEIYKSYQSIKPDSTNNYITANNLITENIVSNGKYSIPKKDFYLQNLPIQFAVFTFTASKLGTMNPKLLSNSKIKTENKIEKQINFKQQ
jgi:hypothetical protein